MIKVNLKQKQNQTELEILKSCISQESPEEVSIGLPFLADLGVGLSVLSCTMLHLYLFVGVTGRSIYWPAFSG